MFHFGQTHAGAGRLVVVAAVACWVVALALLARLWVWAVTGGPA